MILSTAHMEHGLPLVSGLDLDALMGAQVPADLLETLAKAGQMRTIRRLSLVHRATVEDLLESEVNPVKLREMEKAAAFRPYPETFRDALDFFAQLGPSLAALKSSAEPEAEGQPVEQPQPGDSPSGA